jgi:hypothetical protein
MENNLTELPNRWQIKVTKENQNMIKDFFTKENPMASQWFFSIDYIYGFKNDYYFNGDKSFPFLTDEQFKKWVLKETIDWIPKFKVGDKFKSNLTGLEIIIKQIGTCINSAYRLNDNKGFDTENYLIDKCTKIDTIPEYVECIKKVHDNSSPKVGEIIKANSEGTLIGICSYNSITYKECFKPSTKKAFDKQNELEIRTKSISIYKEANLSLGQFTDFHDYFQPPLFGTTTSSGTIITKPINDQNQLYQDVVIIKKPKKVKQLTIINN